MTSGPVTTGSGSARARKGWTTPDQARAVLRKRWDSGALARDRAVDAPVAPISVTLRAPGARELSADFGRVTAWSQTWDVAQRLGWRVERRPVGGRLVGANDVPVRAWVDDEDTLWRLIGVRREVRALEQVLGITREALPGVTAWVQQHPLRAVAAAEVWPGLLATARWLADRVGTDTYVREIDVAGVDTKFVERHRQVLCALVDQLVPADELDTAFGSSDLSRRLRLATKPGYVRLRQLQPGRTVVGPLAEVTARVAELRDVRPEATRAVVLENEITYLSLPPLPDTVAVLGAGYRAERLGDWPWLRDVEVVYWGDLDTHGFAILDRVRRTLPHARSLLMDRQTLLAYRDRWGAEPSPVNTVLPNLTPDENMLYTELVEDVHGRAVRLEQERIPLVAVTATLW